MDAEIARMVAFLGIVILLITAVGGSAPPGWAAMQTTLAQGFPVFTNPFDTVQGTAAFTMRPVSSPSESGFGANQAHPASVTNPGNATANCYGSPTPIRWDGCVRDGPANLASGTFLTLTQARTNVVVGMPPTPGISPDLAVGSITFYYTCRYAGTQYGIDLAFYDYSRRVRAQSAGGEEMCNVGFELHSHTITFVAGSYPPASNFNGGYMKLHAQIGTLGPTVDVAEMSVSISPPVPTNCSGDLVCAVNQIFQTILNAAVFFVNVLVFLGQTAWRFGTLIYNFIVGLVQAFAWLLGIDPASPMFPAPVLVKAVVAVLVFAALTYLIIEGARIIAEIIGAFIP